MNLQEYDRFRYVAEPVFLVYDHIAKDTSEPVVEEMLTYYDELVRYRTLDYLHQFPTRGDNPLLQDAICMKPRIETHEFLDIMDSYFLFYKDDYEAFHNISVKGVW